MSQCEHTGEVLRHADGSIRCLDCEKMIKPNYKTQVAELQQQVKTLQAQVKALLDAVPSAKVRRQNGRL